MTVDIDKNLHRDIKGYCDLNGLKISDFVNELLRKAFLKEKYGEMPPFLMREEKKEETVTSPVVEDEKEVEPEVEIAPVKKNKKRTLK